jgi:drug/metabolite transporter (DMT)-like permease
MDKSMPAEPAAWRAFFAMGLLNNTIPFCLIVWGQGHIASGFAAILNATTPIFTVIVANFSTSDEKVTSNRLLGVILGFAGVVVLTGADAWKGFGVDVLAELAVLLAAISYAFAGVYGRRFRRLGIEPIVTATGQVTASALMLFPIAMLADTPWTIPVPPTVVWLAAIGSALFSTVLAYVLYFRILASAGAINLSLVTFLIPISAIIMGAVGLGEHLAPRHFAGLALIGAGLAAIDGRWLSWRKDAD